MNFTYNFNLLKNVLPTIIKNQNNLKKEYDEKYQTQSEDIELLKQELEKIKEENGPKGILRASKNDFNEIKGTKLKNEVYEMKKKQFNVKNYEEKQKKTTRTTQTKNHLT